MTIRKPQQHDPKLPAEKPGTHVMPGDHPPPEDDFGGGDICSPEVEPPTEDDKPLD
jgi:hypothetical protein